MSCASTLSAPFWFLLGLGLGVTLMGELWTARARQLIPVKARLASARR